MRRLRSCRRATRPAWRWRGSRTSLASASFQNGTSSEAERHDAWCVVCDARRCDTGRRRVQEGPGRWARRVRWWRGAVSHRRASHTTHHASCLSASLLVPFWKEALAKDVLEPRQRQAGRVARLHERSLRIVERGLGYEQVEDRRRTGGVAAVLHVKVLAR